MISRFITWGQINKYRIAHQHIITMASSSSNITTTPATPDITDLLDFSRLNLNSQPVTVTQPDDIAGIDTGPAFEASPHKKWITRIKRADTVSLTEFPHKALFKHVADICLDNDLDAKGKKQRGTIIKFVPIITEAEFKKDAEWIYMFLINGNIVKIGGTRTGLRDRTSSYLCGHHTAERGRSGKCSVTNAVIYNTFEFYLNAGCSITMWAQELPKIEIDVPFIDGQTIKVTAQTYHALESKWMSTYRTLYKKNPVLSLNCDPNY